MLFALVNMTRAESSPPLPPSTPPGYLQIDYRTGYYMNDKPLSVASVHAAREWVWFGSRREPIE